ncbi:AAA family ATPase [Streptomyces sp. NPDC090106]|uniref:AAA family ATPase n=1 Tax=Streptomyces sp. NPDC090106 TaxID=3365946 RepID=UPI0037F67C02
MTSGNSRNSGRGGHGAPGRTPASAAPPVLRLFLLGGFRAERDRGAPVADRWPRPSARRLVEMLAVSPGRTRHREEIIEMCWPETAGTPAALGSLRVALHAARRALEPELTARTPSSYLVGEGALLRLAPQTVWIDADRAESLAERALHSGATADLASALGAFTGELLPEHRYTPWVEARRERLDALGDSVRLALAEAYLADGAVQRAAATARRVLADSAAEERAHRVLIDAYLRQGMRRRALAQYHACRRALDAEWGIRPGPRTEALHRAALATESATLAPRRPAPAGPPVPPAVVHAVSAAPFVGRRAELDQLLDPAGPAVHVVVGEAGIGRTRLAAEAARRAAGAGAAVLWGAGHDDGAQLPYGVFVEALEGRLAGRPAAERARVGAEFPELAALLPSLGQVGPVPGRGGPECERERIHAAVLGLLTAAAPPRGDVLVVLDDVHAADAASLRLLARLARRTPPPGGPRLRFLATCRPEDLPETDPRRTVLDTLVRQGTARRLRLPRLDRADCLALAAGALADPAGDGPQRVWELSLGHPLFALELAKSAPAGPSACADLTPPEGVRLLVADRLARLGPAALRVVEAVAVARGGVAALSDVTEVARATGSTDAVDGIDAALAAAVLEERPVPADGTTVPGLGFRHPLIRLVCRERLSLARRRRLHAAHAELLLRRRPGAVDEVAAHLTAADDPRAAEHLHRAARRAASVGADDTADHYYDALTTRLDEIAAEAARIRLDHAAVLRRMARHQDAVRVLREALTDLGRHGAPHEQVRAAAQLAEALARTGAPAEGFRLLTLHAPGPTAPPETLAAHRLSRAALCFVTGDYEGALRAAGEAEHTARAAAAATTAAEGGLLARALAQRSTALALTGRLAEARSAADEALPHAQAHGDPRLLTHVLSILREHARRSGRLREAVALGRRALDLAERSGDPEATAFERANLAEVHLLLGDTDEAAALAEGAVAEAEAHPGPALPYALAALARVRLRGGPRPGLPAPRELLGRAERALERRPDHQAAYEVRTAQAESALKDARPDRALALLADVRGTGVPVLAAWAHLTAGDPVRAARVAAAEADRAAGAGETVTECEALTVGAAALAAQRRTEEAAVCAARARALAEAMPYPTVLRRVAHADRSG